MWRICRSNLLYRTLSESGLILNYKNRRKDSCRVLSCRMNIQDNNAEAGCVLEIQITIDRQYPFQTDGIFDVLMTYHWILLTTSSISKTPDAQNI